MFRSAQLWTDDQEEKYERWLKTRPICFCCKKPIEDKRYVDFTDYNDFFTYHKECFKEDDYECLKEIWEDYLSDEFESEVDE